MVKAYGQYFRHGFYSLSQNEAMCLGFGSVWCQCSGLSLMQSECLHFFNIISWENAFKYKPEVDLTRCSSLRHWAALTRDPYNTFWDKTQIQYQKNLCADLISKFFNAIFVHFTE
jgi:hypothetical protein